MKEIPNIVGCAQMESPLGSIVVLTTTHSVSRLLYYNKIPKAFRSLQPNRIAKDAIEQLRRYFSDSRFKFTLRLVEAPTAFQKQVRVQLLKIRSGKTVSYKQLAECIHSGSRAVGTACRRNPVPIIVPCHRVIGSDGSLKGYYRARGGGMLDKKRWLLQHEGLVVVEHQVG